MRTTTTMTAIAAALFALSTGVASAQDAGDNSMSRWTGESYAAFEEAAKTGEVKVYIAEPSTDEPSAANDEPRPASDEPARFARISPFRDDTAG